MRMEGWIRRAALLRQQVEEEARDAAANQKAGKHGFLASQSSVVPRRVIAVHSVESWRHHVDAAHEADDELDAKVLQYLFQYGYSDSCRCLLRESQSLSRKRCLSSLEPTLQTQRRVECVVEQGHALDALKAISEGDDPSLYGPCLSQCILESHPHHQALDLVQDHVGALLEGGMEMFERVAAEAIFGEDDGSNSYLMGRHNIGAKLNAKLLHSTQLSVLEAAAAYAAFEENQMSRNHTFPMMFA